MSDTGYPNTPTNPSPQLVKVWDALLEADMAWDAGQEWTCPSHEDNKPSLGVFDGKDGVVIRCQAGCRTKNILNDLGLSFRDIFYKSKSGNKAAPVRKADRAIRDVRKEKRPNPNRTLVSKQVWHYEQADGKRARSVFRNNYDDGTKAIRQKVYIKGEEGYSLYRLPALRRAIRAKQRIVLVEGEKSVDAFDKLEIPNHFVTTAPMGGGSGKWREQYTKQLRGARSVTIIADNDSPGFIYAHSAFVSLSKAGIKVSVRASKTEGKHDDLVDHLAAGYALSELDKLTKEQLDLLASVAPTPDEKSESKSNRHDLWPSPTEPWTCAEKFVRDFYSIDNVRTIITYRNLFYKWNGRNYVETSDGQIKAELYSLFDSAVFEGENGAIPWRPNRSRIGEVLEALRAFCIIPDDTAPGTFLDSGEQSNLIPFANGCLNIADRSIVPASPKLFNLASLPYEWVSDAPKPKTWLKFLKSIWPEDRESISMLQEWMGYLISGKINQQKMLYIWGPKRSGKGTILEIIRELVGVENVAAPTLSGLVGDFGLEPLIGKTVASIGDARFTGRGINSVVERLLTVTGGDAITINRKGKTMPTMKLGVRFNFASNVLPSLSESSGALVARFLFLHTEKSFYGVEDTELSEKLAPELAGIVAWALDGLDRLSNRGRFVEPKSSEDSRADVEELSQPVATFFKECVEFDISAYVTKQSMYEAYREWAIERGYSQLPPIEWFGRDLTSIFPTLKAFRPRINGKQTHSWQGVKLSQAESDNYKAIKIDKTR